MALQLPPAIPAHVSTNIPFSNISTNIPFSNSDGTSVGSMICDVVEKGDLEKLRELLLSASAVALNWSDANNDGRTALHRACSYNRVDCIKLLVETHGIDVNKTDDRGFTAVMWAAYLGQTDCVRVFLSCPGIDLTTTVTAEWRGCLGLSALAIAVKKNHVECIALLKAAANARDGAVANACCVVS